MLLYSTLYLIGVKAVDSEGVKVLDEPALTLDDLKQFRQVDSKTPGHPEFRVTSGVETTTGPLGQGVGTSVGMAMAGQWLAARYNKPGFEVFDYNVYVICSDGDMMIGGPKVAVQQLDPIFKTLAPGRGDIARTPGREKMPGTAEDGYIYCGPSGSGHFVKMVHNGIEYGLMQAYAEGFDIFRNATSKELPEEYRYDLNLPDIAEVWRRGSVVSSC